MPRPRQLLPSCRLQYLQYVGDRLLGALGHAPLYRVAANPLPWLEGIAMK